MAWEVGEREGRGPGNPPRPWCRHCLRLRLCSQGRVALQARGSFRATSAPARRQPLLKTVPCLSCPCPTEPGPHSCRPQGRHRPGPGQRVRPSRLHASNTRSSAKHRSEPSSPTTEPLGSKHSSSRSLLLASSLRGDPLRRRLPDLSPALLPTGERGSSRAQSHCPGDTAAGATKPMGERTRQSSPVKACVTNRPFSRALAFAYKAKGPVSCRQHCRNVPGLPGEGTKGPWEGQSLIPGQPSLPCRSD